MIQPTFIGVGLWNKSYIITSNNFVHAALTSGSAIAASYVELNEEPERASPLNNGYFDQSVGFL